MKRLLWVQAAFCAGVLLLVYVATRGAAQDSAPSGPSATKATVMIKDDAGEIPLKREEQIAFMFVQAIASLEDDCSRHAAEQCSMNALVRGPKTKDEWHLARLKYDPATSDPNYTYKLTLNGGRWEIWATPNKPGLGGFYVKGSAASHDIFYNAKGKATAQDRNIIESAIDGDSFKAH
jgi:hypothetical protein